MSLIAYDYCFQRREENPIRPSAKIARVDDSVQAQMLTVKTINLYIVSTRAV